MFFHTMKIPILKFARFERVREMFAYHALAILVLATFILK